MTFAAEKVKAGRKPFVIVELVLDSCAEAYGVSPCTASQAAAESCYNTRKTCQDPANYNKTTKTMKLCSMVSNFPLGEGFIPCLKGTPAFSSTRLEPDMGLGARGTVTINAADQAWPDRDCDPYWASRIYDWRTQGTFWGKFRARHPYYIGRKMIVKTGYLTSTGGYDAANFRSRTYFLEKISQTGTDGTVSIKGKDVFGLVDEKAAVIPDYSAGQLTAALTAGGSSFSVTAGEGVNYPASNGEVRIGDEVIAYTTRTTDTFSGLTRGARNTTATAHDQDDIVQRCYVMNNLNVVAFIDELLETYGGIDGDLYIPYDAGLTTPTGTNNEWDDEQDDWLSSYDLTGIITEPTPIKHILREVGENCNLGTWWDPVEAKIKLKANVPPRATETVTTLTDNHNIVKGSIRVKDLPERRISRVYISYGEINPTEDRKASNFQFLEGDIDSDSEGADKYDKVALKHIYARFFDSTNTGEAASVSGRLRSRFNEIPQEIEFMLDAKDEDLEVGDLVSLEHDEIPGPDGAALGTQLQIIEAKEVKAGHLYKYVGLSSRYTSRYARIGPNTLGDYGAASAADKATYSWVSNNTGIFSDGDPAYSII